MISFLKNLLLARGRRLVERCFAENPASDEVRLSPLHAPGKYFVDGNTCVWCVSCSVDAPNNIAQDDDAMFAYVFKQPESPKEEEDCKRAMDSCPLAAVRDDGDLLDLTHSDQ